MHSIKKTWLKKVYIQLHQKQFTFIAIKFYSKKILYLCFYSLCHYMIKIMAYIDIGRYGMSILTKTFKKKSKVAFFKKMT